MKKVCTIGSATQDMFINYEGADTLHLHKKDSSCTYLMLEQGTKIDIPSLDYATGGGATNTAVGLSRLGLFVETFFKTGDDTAGNYIRKELAQEKVSTQYCSLTTEHSTARSIIIPSIEHDHVALCYRGANREQKKEDFPLPLLQELDLLFIGPLGGHSQELLPYLAPAASNAGVHVAINPSMKQLTQNTEQFIQALKHVDTVILNTRESGFLMKALLKESKTPLFSYTESSEPLLLSSYLSLGNYQFTLKEVFQQILACGPKTVIVTNGVEGVYVGTQEAVLFHPSISTDPVYSLGAGDAFTSAFLGTQLQGASLSDALQFGILNATSVISHLNAKDGLLSFKELEQQRALVTNLISRSFSY